MIPLILLGVAILASTGLSIALGVVIGRGIERRRAERCKVPVKYIFRDDDAVNEIAHKALSVGVSLGAARAKRMGAN